MNDTGIKSTSDKIYQALIIFILCLFALAAILPFLLLLGSSLTDEAVIMREGYNFWPKEWSLYAYNYLFKTNAAKVFRAYGITFLVTIVGTCISLLIGPMLGWVLSRRDYKRSRVLTFMVFFTMLFNGGIVPSYIMWSQLFHVRDSFWALIFPTLVFNGFFIILYKNNFASNIHPALVEAAKIDGAGELFIYFRIVMPLSLPIIATIGLMVGLGYWNDWTNGLYYITDTTMYSLQQLLKSIMDNISTLASISHLVDTSQLTQGLPGSGIRMAIAVIGVIPVMILYPFFQKAFIAGIALGGVKE